MLFLPLALAFGLIVTSLTAEAQEQSAYRQVDVSPNNLKTHLWELEGCLRFKSGFSYVSHLVVITRESREYVLASRYGESRKSCDQAKQRHDRDKTGLRLTQILNAMQDGRREVQILSDNTCYRSALRFHVDETYASIKPAVYATKTYPTRCRAPITEPASDSDLLLTH